MPLPETLGEQDELVEEERDKDRGDRHGRDHAVVEKAAFPVPPQALRYAQVALYPCMLMSDLDLIEGKDGAPPFGR